MAKPASGFPLKRKGKSVAKADQRRDAANNAKKATK
jgi:hypothetical protein